MLVCLDWLDCQSIFNSDIEVKDPKLIEFFLIWCMFDEDML